MPKSYADLLREARAQIKEVTPQEVDALPAGAATIVDVREASEWEQGHLPGARHVSKSYIEQQIEGAAPDRDAPVILYCAGGVRSLFAAQTLADGRELGFDWDKVNVNGGAIALGHPIGASGARIVATLLHELRRREGRYGLATLCLGGGGSVAMAVERVD